MALERRLRRAEKAVGGGWPTFRCTGCGKGFNTLTDTWLDLFVRKMSDEDTRDEAPRDRCMVELEGYPDRRKDNDESYAETERRRGFLPARGVA